MAEEFKNLAAVQTFSNVGNSNKGFNASAQEFNPKRMSK